MIPIHFLSDLKPHLAEHLRAKLDPAFRLSLGPDTPPSDCRFLIADELDRATLAALPNLEAVIIPYVGAPVSTLRLIREDFPGLAVHNLHHNADSAAEFTLGLLLAAAKLFVPADARFRAHDWRPRHDPTPSLLLHGRRALILGYGAIGMRVAALCRALGMKVIALKRQVGEGEVYPDEVHPISELGRLLPRTDALILCLPLTEETRGLIGAAELALMPPGGLLVNIGRGPLVQEGALYAALKSGQLFGAGLDVWYRYPEPADYAHYPPSNYPFHELDNVVMSPHRGGGVEVDEMEFVRMEGLADLLNHAARGEALPNRVDLERGY
jgi:phosphoglycerate dehydrogenase-like enzyme